MITFIKQMLSRYRQIVKYGIIGACCAGLDFVVFLILYAILQRELSVEAFNIKINSAHFGSLLVHGDNKLIIALLANTVSVHFGIFASFFLNRHFTFNVKDLTVHRFASFYLVGIAGLIMSSLLLVVFADVLGIDTHISKALTIFFVALTQFLLNKFVSFKHGT